MTPPPKSAPADFGSTVTGTGTDLTFSWKNPVDHRLRLAFFLLVAAAFHIAFFYLFRVVYPQPARSIPSPQRITLLNPSNPEVRPLLAQVADRAASYIAGDNRSADLTDYTTRFVPSFRDFDLALRIPAERRIPAPLPVLTQPGTTILPPLAAASPNSAAVKLSLPVPKWALGPTLADRTILHAPEFDPAALAALPERRARFSAGFDPLGRPIYILPLDTSETPGVGVTAPTLRTTLTPLLNTLRLNPTKTPTSGTLTLTW